MPARALPLVVTAGAALTLGSAAFGASSAAAGRPVVVIPIGHVGAASVRAFADAMRSQLALSVRVGKRLPVAASVRNEQRKQVSAERLVLYLRRSLAVARDSRTVVIGLTNQDIYPQLAGWRWSFAERNGRTGVVSVARMDPSSFGLEPNRPLLLRRLRKYAVRYGALLALGRPMVIEPRSVLYGAITSLDDLDFAEPTATPRPYPAARVAWLTRAARSCRLAGGIWAEVARQLKNADPRQARPLLVRWAAADDQLAAALRPQVSSIPQPARVAVITTLAARAAYLRDAARSAAGVEAFSLRHVQSLGGTLHAAFLEAGSRPCGNQTNS